ncbi:hypothetical protein CS369_22090 [Candidatus Symbiopectobacterium sp. 'North America']|uniref:hypothetical protein n=1 Tax=Candidatus Symbiopectobacterium sp. 'North America' TaxID=2794574 RepID=UPI0018CBA775|nr:hypothetical protein [Candidatus Symbiopectobacterium sp. 'North America']MBG6246725.1 hypothetical protein [Candidatus Symbiopectobacterium sp. 'North America']
MKTIDEVKVRFLDNVSGHLMTIHRDDGLYRHVQFSRPGTNCYRFDLITWPGYLCVTGDVGCWTFSRIADMFEFFACNFDRGINPGYWAEKLQAGAGCSYQKLCFEWDHGAFMTALREWHENWLDEGQNEDDKESAEDSIGVIKMNSEDAHSAWRALEDADLPGIDIYDFADHRFETHTTHYLWICHAIVWGIQRYNASKQSAQAEVTNDQP